MSNKQAFAAIVSGILLALVGGLLIIPIQLIYEATGRRVGGGDDGWGFLWIILMLLSGIVGFILSAKWARNRYADFQA
jgi:hypothetical protein